MIQWPSILKLEGDAELIYLDNVDEFVFELNHLLATNEDYLIDSCGLVYSVRELIDESQTQPKRTITLSEVINLIREHEFSQAQTCLTKITFHSMTEAIASLKPIEP